MGVTEQFKNAPIQEAILDLRVTLSEATTLQDLESFYNADIKNKFPKKLNREHFSGEVSIDNQGQVEILPPNRELDGFVFLSVPEYKIVQSRRDGFTFNILNPYSNWEDTLKESKSLWDRYAQVAKPLNVMRLGLRYINIINIPRPCKNLSLYIKNIPKLIENSNLEYDESFFIRYSLSKKDSLLKSVINLTIEKHLSDSAFLPLVFDIDVFYNCDLQPLDSVIWKHFEELRIFKNEIFFENITEVTKELFR